MSNEYDDDEVFKDPSNILGHSSDEVDDKLVLGEEETEKKSKLKGFSNWPTWKKVAAVIGAIVVVLIVAGMVTGGDKKDDEKQQTTTQGSFDGINVNEQVGVAYIGNDDGAPVNGTGAILAFDYQYYQKRSGEGVIKNFNPNNTDYSADFVQNYIDQVPAGTQYQLSITPISLGDKYNVILTVVLPGAEPVKYNQQFTVMKRGDRYYVKEFSSREITEN